MTTPMPTFPEFYRAINDQDPFPWQARLAGKIATTEKWPEEIGVPTGLGKTACLEIAVWWLASQADRPPESRIAPTRIWWVVNRRLLVDSTASQARKIADLLSGCGSKDTVNSSQNTLAKVADRLRSLSADPKALPLKVILLRGGIASRTPTDPSCPTVILCTLPMYGSRLLFRGYGSKLRAVDAAMAGTDSLVLLDEAHLAPHLKSLMCALTDCIPSKRSLFNGRRSTAMVVALTATGGPDCGQRFDLDDDDKRDAVIRKRLDATKPLELCIKDSGKIAHHLVDAAINLMHQTSEKASFLIFANTPKTAREVFNRLQKNTAKENPAPDLFLLTGLTREQGADSIRADILDPVRGMPATRPEASRQCHLIVVATQTLEVGADIDAEYLVTEACGVRALTQRLGRLNRFGKHQHARGVYVHLTTNMVGTAKAMGLELCIKDSGEIAHHLAAAAISLMHQTSKPASFLIFANTSKIACEVFKHLQKNTAKENPAPKLSLLTDRTRGKEAVRQPHLIVATPTLEVGADIDAEYLVTEACGVCALTQRLGRLNWFKHKQARAVYVEKDVGTSKGKKEDFWPVYGKEPEVVLKRLKDAERKTEGMVNLSPRQVAEVLGAPSEDLGRAPEVLPGILWEWIKTTTPPEEEAPVEPYFSGIANPEYVVSLIWRVHVPAACKRLWPRATAREAVEIPIKEFRDTLGDNTPIHRLARDGVTVEEVLSDNLRPGDQIVLPTDRGLLDRFGWNASATDPVMDISLNKQGLPLDPTAIKRLCGVNLTSLIERVVGTDADEIDEAERNRTISEILERIQNIETPQGWDAVAWSKFTNSLEPQILEAREEVPRLKVSEPARETPVDEFDETSRGTVATLDEHGQAVGTRAREIAEHIGVPAPLCKVIELAGSLHDIGKAERRFQRWLDPEDKYGEPVAKSNAPRHRWETMRAEAGWPRGGRHENLSARLIRAWLNKQSDWGTCLERDLLIHLVISHHGKGRPLVPPVCDGTHETVCRVVLGIPVKAIADLADIDWNQPTRFKRLNDNFGPWELALLEAIVIRSDHAISRHGG